MRPIRKLTVVVTVDAKRKKWNWAPLVMRKKASSGRPLDDHSALVTNVSISFEGPSIGLARSRRIIGPDWRMCSRSTALLLLGALSAVAAAQSSRVDLGSRLTLNPISPPGAPASANGAEPERFSGWRWPCRPAPVAEEGHSCSVRSVAVSAGAEDPARGYPALATQAGTRHSAAYTLLPFPILLPSSYSPPQVTSN